MQQTVLMTAVRGPDGTPKYGPVKMLLRWYRRCVLVSSLDGIVLDRPWNHPGSTEGGSFMGPSFTLNDPYGPRGSYRPAWDGQMDRIVDEYLRTLDALPHHFQLHFMHAAEIVGYKHPDRIIRDWWNGVYGRLVKDMHLKPETVEDMDERLGDRRDGWLKHADKATVA